jgi:hypothetical protein
MNHEHQLPPGEQAYALFMAIPPGLLLPDTLLLKVTVAVNVKLKALGLPLVRLWRPSELKMLSGPAAEAAVTFIPTLRQISVPSVSEIAKLL